MLNFDEFFNLFNGTLVDFDNFFGDQCVDLVQFWSRSINGPRFAGDAQDIFKEAGTSYDQINNTPTNFPQKGDIVVWSSQFNGKVGHAGIATGVGDSKTFEAFEQNDPVGSNCHLKTYDYTAVLGWLHPKVTPQDQSTQLSQSNADRDTNWRMIIAIFAALGVNLDSSDKEHSKNEAVNKINELKTQHDKDSAELVTLNQTITTLSSGNKDYSAELIDAQHQATDLQSTLNSLKDALGAPSASLKDLLSAIDTLKTPHDQVVKQVVPVMDALAEAAISKKQPKKVTLKDNILEFLKKGGVYGFFSR